MKKKKKILFFVIMCSILGCSNLKYLKKFDGYLPNPKEVKSSKYKIVKMEDGSIKKELVNETLLYFDSLGRKIGTQSFKKDGSKGMSSSYVYNKYGNLIQNTYRNSDGTLISNNVYTYNKKGQKLVREHNTVNKRLFTYYKYDKKNNNISEIYENGKNVFKYNKNGYKVEALTFDVKNKKQTKIIFVYDDEGNEKEIKIFNSNGYMNTLYKREYDKKNNIFKIENFKVNKSDTILTKTTSFEYEYDKRGNIVKETMYLNKIPARVREMNYIYW